MSKLEFKLKQDPGLTQIIFSGQIDETFPPELHKIEFGQTLSIDLQNVTAINSLGIREWIKFIGHIGTINLEIFNCPKLFIDQVNMVQGFIPSPYSIKSFYVPYFNEEESLEKNVLFTFGKEYGTGPLKINGSVTDEKGIRFEIDVIESKYFNFLKSS
ncbi:MAG: hypothetical protein B7Y39_10955 [Bdellovibrio sp. 28-41-41]|nr:MAG: hypothetical protein B7Y39_10955 [Bdellovibrio sp. 28-41-41]